MQSDEQLLAECSQHLQDANAKGDLIFKEMLEYKSTGLWLGLLHEQDVVIKALKRSIVRNSREHIDAAREVALLMGLEHPHVIDYKGCLLTGDGVLWIVMGFCSKKTLCQRISSSGISANYALRIPGLEKQIPPSGLDYVAPEMQEANKSPTPKSDIYSFGQLLHDIFPIETSSGSDSQRQRRGITTRCLRLAYQCQTDDPDKRPSTKKIVQVLESIQKGPGSNQKPQSSRDLRQKRSLGCMTDCWANFLAVLSCGFIRPAEISGPSGQRYTRLLESETSEENTSLLARLHIPSGEENRPQNVPEVVNAIADNREVVSMQDLKDFNGSKNKTNSLCPIAVVDYGPSTSEKRAALEKYIGEYLRMDREMLPEYGEFLSTDLLDCQAWKELVVYFFGPRTQAFRSSQHWRVIKKIFLKQVVPSIGGFSSLFDIMTKVGLLFLKDL
ncbi:hypothetical protein BSKO_09908 [Bryopsis sp. KO-2023]|nr:hypothetical protein BSKO_09908 [Bryopsis sp. KO-2023]